MSETLAPYRDAIQQAYYGDETACLQPLLENASFAPNIRNLIQKTAEDLVLAVRERAKHYRLSIDAFLGQYQLHTDEGLAIMCLAEALLRVPDATTANRLIRDKVADFDWAAHIGKSEFFAVNAATWGLLITDKLISPVDGRQRVMRGLKSVLTRTSEPIIRQVTRSAMRIVGRQFVLSETIEHAMKLVRKGEARHFRFSFDMLGEAALTAEDADRYFQDYLHALDVVGRHADPAAGSIDNHGVSVKLSALHPRYTYTQAAKAVPALSARLLTLAEKAKSYNIGLTVDAEEAERLELSLNIIENVTRSKSLRGWDGLGMAVQAYQKRAWWVIDWAAALAAETGQRLMIRLVKGAYWDSEIKHAQMQGYADYPVFTRKRNTDISYLACAQKLLRHNACLYPQFATHNIQTVATLLETTKGRPFEFQCLQGMGQALYHRVTIEQQHPCRIYAPVGGHADLLSYLVRRLLENGANTSFVNQLNDPEQTLATLTADPAESVSQLQNRRHPHIPLPPLLYGAERPNAVGLDLSDAPTWQQLHADMQPALAQVWEARPSTKPNAQLEELQQVVVDPSDHRRIVGHVLTANFKDVTQALATVQAAQPAWSAQPVTERAAVLRTLADDYERAMPTLMGLLCREAGKTVHDALGEIREAIDFCRYYADQAETTLQPRDCGGPTGERNTLSWHGRGVLACISPWNFPLAIFTGQIVAALVAGNAVLAKPAEQTPLIAAEAVRMMLAAGIPPDVLQLLPGDRDLGASLVHAPEIAGVMFTGSTTAAKAIQQALAQQEGPIRPLIAETGGQNAMIVDSSALPEQAVQDILISAFGSAGQRCSACRILYVQDDIADAFLTMLEGAAKEWVLGEPSDLATDIGPVIDARAKERLLEHIHYLRGFATPLFELDLPQTTDHGTFIGPCAFEISSLKLLQEEVFGPILHVIRFKADELHEVIDAVNATGYALTLGIHSRIDATIDAVIQRAAAGNVYVNRSIIGSVVGVQPFGGHHLSGTGPKAGGPNYLQHLATERTTTVNTAAVGGNTQLVNLRED